MTVKERRKEIAELAAQEAASHHSTDHLAAIYKQALQQEDELRTRIIVLEREIKRRWEEHIPSGTPVVLNRTLEEAEVRAFVRGVYMIADDGEPLWSLWKAKSDGAPSKFRWPHPLRTHEFSVVIQLGTRP